MKKITLALALCFGTQLSIAQSSCNTALSISVGSNYYIGTINGSAPPTVCAGDGNATAGAWFKYTATKTKNIIINSDLEANSGKDTRFQVYSGDCGNLTCHGGDDDSGSVGNGYLAVASFVATAGNTYYIVFDNRWNNSNNFSFEVTEGVYAPMPVSFTQQTIAQMANICSVADMNGDYLDDIVIAQNNQMIIMTQLPTGGFATNTYSLPNLSTLPGWSIAAGDYDKNGFNDLVFGGGSRLTVIRANATGTGYTEVPYPQGIFTQRTNFIDINNDGNLDLFACHDVAQSHAYRNDGNGNLIFEIPFFPTLAVGGNYASIWTDYNNDGYQDMYLAKCRGGAPVGDPQRINLLYRNNGNGTFTEVGAAAGVNDGAQSWSTAIEDFDNDGDMDFLLSNISDTNKLYRNNGDGTFTDVYASSGIAAQVGSWEIQAADFNNDGLIDFLWQNGKELYINNGNLTFTGYDLPFSEGAIGDLNNDGFLDVQMGNKIYYNVPNDNNWIKINLKGTISNSNGIGARVEIHGTWGKQIRDIRSGQGFSHQSTLNAHFGIGEAEAIEKVVIKWPSGTIDTVLNPTINQALLITEQSTLGVTENQNSLFSLYPNPAKNTINIKFKQTDSQITEAKIFDLNGRLSSQPKIIDNTVNVQNLSSGTYILVLKNTDGAKYSQKFIKE